MKITTWNVNSIRSRLESTKKVIEKLRPDILCLQETKVINDLFKVNAIISYLFVPFDFDRLLDTDNFQTKTINYPQIGFEKFAFD